MQCIPGLDDCDDSATYMRFPDGHHCVCNIVGSLKMESHVQIHTYSTLHACMQILISI